jgi:hypothetical protein
MQVFVELTNTPDAMIRALRKIERHASDVPSRMEGRRPGQRSVFDPPLNGKAH